METVKIDGVTYHILSKREFDVDGNKRIAMFLQRPQGGRKYHAIRYETGRISSVVPCF
jgi:hypothetical protein